MNVFPLIRRRRTLVGSVLLVLSLGAHGGQALLQDRGQIEDHLKVARQCCVVDARSVLQRMQTPIPEAVIYGADTALKPTSTVVVVADDDRKAVAVAESIVKASGAKLVLAVKGGYRTWNQIARAQRAASPPAGGTFVIPKNTCESGTSIQILKSDKK